MSRQPLILDLGNVVLRLDFARFVDRAAARGTRSANEIHARYIDGDRKREFERGRLAEKDFFDDMARWLKWPACEMAELMRIWADVFDGIPEVPSYLENLTTQQSLWLMSDTNETHWRHVQEKFPYLSVFERSFTSYTSGRLKIDPGAWSPVLAALECPPADVLFFDDQPANVSAARAAGFNGRLFSSWQMLLRSVLG